MNTALRINFDLTHTHTHQANPSLSLLVSRTVCVTDRRPRFLPKRIWGSHTSQCIVLQEDQTDRHTWFPDGDGQEVHRAVCSLQNHTAEPHWGRQKSIRPRLRVRRNLVHSPVCLFHNHTGLDRTCGHTEVAAEHQAAAYHSLSADEDLTGLLAFI